MVKKVVAVVLILAVLGGLAYFIWYKTSKKTGDDISSSDTTTVAPLSNMMLPPHGDTTLIPVLSKILDSALVFSNKKDYASFAKFIVYRGPEPARHGMDVFTVKNKYEKTIVKVTADVFNKWTTGVESKEYVRLFDVPMEDGSPMPMLEVIFISKKNVNRKFFGFLKVKEQYRIAEVISSLPGYN